MPGFLRQSTASQARALGPFVDDTDFKTPETGLTIANTDIKLVVNGAAAVDKNSGGGTHRVNGVYGVTFDATDTATVGELEVSVIVAGALIVFDKFTILEEAVYDALFAASAPGYLQPTTAGRTLDVSAGGEAGIDWANIGSPATAQNLSATNIDVDQIVASVSGAVGSVTGNVGGNVVGSVASVTARVTANVDQLGGVAQSLTDLKDFADDGYDPATNKVQGVVLVDTLTTYTGNTPQTGDSFARLGAPAGASVSADVAAVKAQTAAIETDTQDLQARLPAALTGDGNIKADTLRVGGTLQTAGDIIGDTNDLQARLPAALVGGRIDSTVGAMQANTLTAAALATDAVNEIVAATFARTFSAAYGGLTFDEIMKVLVATQAAKTAGAATATFTIRNLDDSADVVVATVDADGNRSQTTVTP